MGGRISARSALYQDAPNPFNSQTVLRFDLAQPQYVELDIYNLSGQKIVTLVHGERAAGTYIMHALGRARWPRAGASQWNLSLSL